LPAACEEGINQTGQCLRADLKLPRSGVQRFHREPPIKEALDDSAAFERKYSFFLRVAAEGTKTIEIHSRHVQHLEFGYRGLLWSQLMGPMQDCDSWRGKTDESPGNTKVEDPDTGRDGQIKGVDPDDAHAVRREGLPICRSQAPRD
jgi:hypothetical protein